MTDRPVDLVAYVAYYLERLDGPEADSAYHCLVEAPNGAAPPLTEAYHRETRTSRRAAIATEPATGE